MADESDVAKKREVGRLVAIDALRILADTLDRREIEFLGVQTEYGYSESEKDGMRVKKPSGEEWITIYYFREPEL